MWSKIVIMPVVLMFTLIVAGQNVPKNAGKDKEHGIDWKLSLQPALQEAEQTGKPVMVDFWATWCAPCRAMDKRTYIHPSVLAQAKNFILVKIDIEKAPEEAGRYQVETPPKVVFLKADGSVIASFVGFRDAAGTVRSMKSALSKSNKNNKIPVPNRKIPHSARVRKF
jgi:thiol:disulfide interchange protein DsbD